MMTGKNLGGVINKIKKSFVNNRFSSNEKIIGFVIAPQNSELTRNQILPHLDYFNQKSGNFIDFFFVGYYKAMRSKYQPVYKDWYFNPVFFNGFVTEIEERTNNWNYQGGVELILLNANYDKGYNEVVLEFWNSVVIDITKSDKIKNIGVSKVFKKVFEIAENQEKLGSSWGLNKLQNHFASNLDGLILSAVYDNINKLDEFAQMVSDLTFSEVELTKHLASIENQFILKSYFLANSIFDEIECSWHYDANRAAIRPDFFVVKQDNFADIVEFKLPDIGKSVVGTENRETFSAKINSYISQVRTYIEYFEENAHREWIKNKYMFNIRYPKGYIVLGRDKDFDIEETKKIIANINNIDMITYDNIIETVITHFKTLMNINIINGSPAIA